MTPTLRSLARAPTRPAKFTGTTLPPLLRVWAAEVTGVPAKLARHDGYHLPPIRRADPTRNAADVSEGARDQEPRSQKSSSGEDLLSVREVVNVLRRCRYERSRRIPIARIAAAAGLSRHTLYVAMNTGAVSEQTCVALTPILREIAAGTLGFRRRARRWEEIEYSQAPDRPPPPQPRLVRAEDWHERARCQSCGSPHFSSFMADKLYFACDGCVGETDRQMLGARR